MADALQPSNWDELADGNLDGFFALFGDEGPFPSETKEETSAAPEQPIVKDGVPGRPLPKPGHDLMPGPVPWAGANTFAETPDTGTIRGVYTKEKFDYDSGFQALRATEIGMDDAQESANNSAVTVLHLLGLNPNDYEDEDHGIPHLNGANVEFRRYLLRGGIMTHALNVAYKNMIDHTNTFDKLNENHGKHSDDYVRARDRWRDRMKKPPPAPHEADKEHSQRPGQRIDGGKRQRLDRPPEGRRLEFGTLSLDG